MGPRSTSVTLRAFHATEKGLKVGDVTGEDMDGYASVSVKKLPSPVLGQICSCSGDKPPERTVLTFVCEVTLTMAASSGPCGCPPMNGATS